MGLGLVGLGFGVRVDDRDRFCVPSRENVG